VAERLRLYAAVDSMVQLTWPTSAQPPLRHCTVEPVLLLQGGAMADAQCRAVERLWQAMAGAMTDVALGVRDARWLRWRYLEHPHVPYRVALLRNRWLKRPIGVLVTRERDDAHELLDLIARPADFGALLGAARSLARSAGKPWLRAWITRSQMQRLAGGDGAPAQVDDLSIQVPANLHTAGPDPVLLQNRWFLMAGDADFT
jgi:hypothetical protein